MEIIVKDIKNAEKGKISLPVHFDEFVRMDLIKRAIEIYQARNRQRYGAKPEAGKRASAKLSRRRHNYRGSYGFGISRVPRKILSRRGTRMMWVGAFAPGMVGGRRAHAPKAEKIWDKKMNVKERRMAIRCAISATMQKDLVASRGHKVPTDYPFVVEDKMENLDKTKDFVTMLKALGYEEELKRTSVRKIRAGKGKARGRKYKIKKGPLVVVSDKCPLQKLGNVQGVEVVVVNHLNISDLAPGAAAGRVSIWSESAIKKLKENSLFQ